MTPTCAEERAVLQSVIHASLFDYPLTLAQLCESLVEVSADEASIAAWCRTSALLQATVEHRDHLYFPAGRGDLVETRARREALSRELLHRHRSVLQFVAHMPFVRMVALSGSLAHLNADPAADVDLFVITAAKRVWLVTVAVLLVAKVLGWRRRLCLNYVISERQMAITPTDLFTANQIIHLLPLAGYGTYRRFLNANAFVSRWYPNFVPRDRGSGIRDQGSLTLERVLSYGVAQVAERVCRAVYRWHLRRRSASWQSSDQVRLEDECLKLHTSSHRAETMARFEAAMAGAEMRPPGTRTRVTPSTDQDTTASVNTRKQA